MTGTRPETPPRYRYVRTGTSDDEQENDGNGNTVLAARKRAGSVGRPVLISRRLDRQRHGGTQVLSEAAVPPQSVLQAPALLGLGCIDAPFGLDIFTRRHQGGPENCMFAMDFAANVPSECRTCSGNDPMARIPAVPAAPSFAWPCMTAKSACRSQSVGTNVRRESAFLRPSSSVFGAPAPAPTTAPPPPSHPHSVFSHVPPRCHSFSWQSAHGTNASACLQSDGQEHLPPQPGSGPVFTSKPEEDVQVVQANIFKFQPCAPCTRSIFASVDEHPSTWQQEPQKHSALQELQPQQGSMPRQTGKDSQKLAGKLQSSQTQVEHEQFSGGSCEQAAADLNSVQDGRVARATRSGSRSQPEFGGPTIPPRRSQMSGARILITGASGLLGRQVMKAFSTWQVQGICKRRANIPNVAACDLTKEAAVAQLMEHFRPHVVLHLAAEWRPEVLRQRPEQARQLNVDATGFVATACERLGAWLVHVSADCVFDGTSPPYTTNSKPNPLSEYGWHKLHSEQLAQAACPEAAVLRVPLLYGPLAESLSESAVTSLCSDLKSGIREVDAWQQCYPTWTGDVAIVLKNMVELHLAGECLKGIYHFSSSERFTWYEMMLIVAKVSGLDASGISAVRSPPGTSLPRDTQLDCSRLTQLLGRFPETRLHDGLQQCLPFRDGCAARAEHEQAGGTVDPDPRSHGATLQKVFWEELERTRRRLRQAGINQQRRAEGGSRGREIDDKLAQSGEQRLYEQQV